MTPAREQLQSPAGFMKNLTAEIKKIQIEEIRSTTEDLFECVVSSPHFAALENILNSFFGLAIKPKGKTPTPQDEQCSTPQGGVRANQVLYVKDHHACLLWPWENGRQLTVKIYKF